MGERMSSNDLWAFRGDKPRLVAFVTREIRLVLVAALVALGYFLR
jgi:hypothetical protein